MFEIHGFNKREGDRIELTLSLSTRIDDYIDFLDGLVERIVGTDASEWLYDTVKSIAEECTACIIRDAEARDKLVKTAIEELFSDVKHSVQRVAPGVYRVAFDAKSYEDLYGTIEDAMDILIDINELNDVYEMLEDWVVDCIHERILAAARHRGKC